MVKNKKKTYMFLFAIAFVSMLFATKCSPIYPMNDWVDVNIFFTIGKAIPKGYKLYFDLFDHKGPILYLVYALGSLISYYTFIGIYFIEVIASFFYLVYTYKTLELFIGKRALPLMPLAAALPYSTTAFWHGGSTEELCYPFFAYAIYVLIKSLMEDKLPKKWEAFAIGITSGCIFWSKFTLLGLYVGWIVVLFAVAIQKKEWLPFVRLCLMVAAGVVAMTIPVIVFLKLNGSLKACYEVYFYDNVMLYRQNQGIDIRETLYKLRNGMENVLMFNKSSLVFSVIGAIWLRIRRRPAVFWGYFAMVIASFIMLFYGRNGYPYSSCPLGVFIPMGVVAVYDIAVNRLKLATTIKPLLPSIAGFLIILCFSHNIYMLQYEKEDLPQYKAKEIIENSGIKDPTLLNFAWYDGGFYTPLGMIPPFKYFFQPTMNLPEMYEEQGRYVAEQIPDFLILKKEDDIPGYTLVDSWNYDDGEGGITYYLRVRTISLNDRIPRR